MEAQVIKVPSRLRLLLTCIVKRVNFKYPKTLGESIAVDYLKNRWITLDRLATCYGFSEAKTRKLIQEVIKW